MDLATNGPSVYNCTITTRVGSIEPQNKEALLVGVIEEIPVAAVRSFSMILYSQSQISPP